MRDTSVVTFAALGDATRIALVERLSREGPQSLSRLASGRDVTRQAISKHLRILEQAGLAKQRASGRERIWALTPHGFDDAQAFMVEVSEQWDRAIDRLRSFVETEGTGP